MNPPLSTPSLPRRARGASLVEAVIAVGVLAVALPLVVGTLASGGSSGLAARAETRSPWIVQACLQEVAASRAGRSTEFPATSTGDSLPPGGEVWALAFAADGSLLGRADAAAHGAGLREQNGRPVAYLASIAASPDEAEDEGLLRLRVSVEYPASAPAARRERIDFFSRIP